MRNYACRARMVQGLIPQATMRVRCAFQMMYHLPLRVAGVGNLHGNGSPECPPTVSSHDPRTLRGGMDGRPNWKPLPNNSVRPMWHITAVDGLSGNVTRPQTMPWHCQNVGAALTLREAQTVQIEAGTRGSQISLWPLWLCRGDRGPGDLANVGREQPTMPWHCQNVDAASVMPPRTTIW